MAKKKPTATSDATRGNRPRASLVNPRKRGKSRKKANVANRRRTAEARLFPAVPNSVIGAKHDPS